MGDTGAVPLKLGRYVRADAIGVRSRSVRARGRGSMSESSHALWLLTPCHRTR